MNRSVTSPTIGLLKRQIQELEDAIEGFLTYKLHPHDVQKRFENLREICGDLASQTKQLDFDPLRWVDDVLRFLSEAVELLQNYQSD